MSLAVLTSMRPTEMLKHGRGRSWEGEGAGGHEGGRGRVVRLRKWSFGLPAVFVMTRLQRGNFGWCGEVRSGGRCHHPLRRYVRLEGEQSLMLNSSRASRRQIHFGITRTRADKNRGHRFSYDQ